MPNNNKEVKIKITGDVKDIEKKLNQLESRLKKLSSNADKIGDNNGFDKMEKDIKETTDSAEKLDKELDEVGKSGKSLSDLGEKFEDLGNKIESLTGGGALGQLKDGLSNIAKGDIAGGITNIGGAIKGLNSPTTTALAGISALVLGFNKLYQAGKQRFAQGLQEIGAVCQTIFAPIKAIGSAFISSFESITGFDLSLSNAIQTGVQFEDTITRAGAIMGATGSDFDRLSDSARNWGATTRYSGNEVAEAFTYMGMAGWTVQESLDGIEGVLNLATVGALDLATASDFVTDGLTALGMSAGQANDFVDMLSSTIVNSNTSVEQMQSAFTNVAPIAGTLGVSMSDLSVAIGLMSDQGVKGAKAGTALKNLMTNMVNPTDTMTDAINRYGLGTAQTLIQQGKLIEGIKEMKTQMEGLDASTKASIVAQIAGKEALSGVSALLNTNVSRINELQFAVDSSTKSSRMFAQSLGLVDQEGKLVKGTFEEMVSTQGDAYKKWQNFTDIMEECGNTMTWVGGSTTDLGAIIHRLGLDGEVTAEQVNEVLNVFDKLKDGSEEVTSVLKEHGIQLGLTEDGYFDFGETLKNLGAKWDTLSDSQKQTLASQLGLKGSVEELDELFGNQGESIEELIDTYERAEGVSEHLAETFDSTLKGAMSNLASAIEERFLQAFDKIKPAVEKVIEVLTTFFDIWNGKSLEFPQLKGLADALEWLAGESEKWGEVIKNGIVNAIKGIDDFVNGGSLDSILQIGTNIIQGICKGIQEAKDNGTLDSAISGAIRKICEWIDTNSDDVIKAGKDIIESIKNGISENSEEINEACDDIYDVINTYLLGKETALSQLGVTCGSAIVKGFVLGAIPGFLIGCGEVIAVIISGLNGFLNDLGDVGKDLANAVMEGWLGSEDWEKVKKEFGDFVDWTREKLDELNRAMGGNGLDTNGDFNENKSEMSQRRLGDDKNKPLTNRLSEDVHSAEALIEEKSAIIGGKAIDGIDGEMKKGKEKTDATSAEIASGIEEHISEKLASMDTAQLKELQQALTDVSNTTSEVATSMSTSFTTIQDSARTSFQGLFNIANNQLINIRDTVRTNMLGVSNIISNQITNARQIFTEKCMSMASVARTQFVNISNIVRNQGQSWYNVINNQITNARNRFTNQTMSMYSVANTQMTKITTTIRTNAQNWYNIVNNQASKMPKALESGMSSMGSTAQKAMQKVVSAVREGMATAKSIASTPITINIQSNIQRKVTTTHVAGGLMQTMASMNANMIQVSAPKANTLSSNINTNSNRVVNGSSALMLEVPLYLDGREVARATAKYNEAELDKLSKRNARKRGE